MIVVAPSKVSLPASGGVTWFCHVGAKWMLTINCSTVDEPVAVLPLALVTANSTGVDHCDRVVSIKSDGRVGGSQCEVRTLRNLYNTI